MRHAVNRLVPKANLRKSQNVSPYVPQTQKVATLRHHRNQATEASILVKRLGDKTQSKANSKELRDFARKPNSKPDKKSRLIQWSGKYNHPAQQQVPQMEPHLEQHVSSQPVHQTERRKKSMRGKHPMIRGSSNRLCRANRRERHRLSRGGCSSHHMSSVTHRQSQDSRARGGCPLGSGSSF